MTDRKHIALPFSITCLMSLLIFGPCFGVARAQDLPPEILGYADMVLYNGQVLAMDRDQPPIAVTQAVAIREGLIMAVGENDRILQMAGPNTVRVNLDGKAVIPGVVDTHSHPNSYAVSHYNSEVAPAYVKYLEENQVRFPKIRWEEKETALSD